MSCQPIFKQTSAFPADKVLTLYPTQVSARWQLQHGAKHAPALVLFGGSWAGANRVARLPWSCLHIATLCLHAHSPQPPAPASMHHPISCTPRLHAAPAAGTHALTLLPVRSPPLPSTLTLLPLLPVRSPPLLSTPLRWWTRRRCGRSSSCTARCVWGAGRCEVQGQQLKELLVHCEVCWWWGRCVGRVGGALPEAGARACARVAASGVLV